MRRYEELYTFLDLNTGVAYFDDQRLLIKSPIKEEMHLYPSSEIKNDLKRHQQKREKDMTIWLLRFPYEEKKPKKSQWGLSQCFKKIDKNIFNMLSRVSDENTQECNIEPSTLDRKSHIKYIIGIMITFSEEFVIRIDDELYIVRKIESDIWLKCVLKFTKDMKTKKVIYGKPLNSDGTK